MSGLVIYIISQILVTCAMLLQGSTFFVFNRQRQLWLNISTNVLYAVSFFLLGGYVAVAMGIIAVARDVVRSWLDKLQDAGKIKPSRRRDMLLLGLWCVLFTVGAAVTADGLLSVLPYFSSMIFTIAIWQSNLLIYRFSGVLTNSIMIVYNVFLFNLMGILLQVGMTLFAVVGVVSYFLHRDNQVIEK